MRRAPARVVVRGPAHGPGLPGAAPRPSLRIGGRTHPGGREDGGGSTGHASGRAIVEILRRRKGDLTDSDYAHMPKVNGYVHGHLAQRPSGDVRDGRWRHSLMNWGHDPLDES